jgi:hypothetical protein
MCCCTPLSLTTVVLFLVFLYEVAFLPPWVLEPVLPLFAPTCIGGFVQPKAGEAQLPSCCLLFARHYRSSDTRVVPWLAAATPATVVALWLTNDFLPPGDLVGGPASEPDKALLQRHWCLHRHHVSTALLRFPPFRYRSRLCRLWAPWVE